MKELQQVLEADQRVSYALLFGSGARESRREESDLDIAIGLARGARFGARDLGDLISTLERAAAGRKVDVVLIDEAPPAIAFRVFRDGSPLLVRDRAALVARKARAILEYLDFQPIEELAARGAIAAAAHGR
jgi:predicted nucleotidyltransferase